MLSRRQLQALLGCVYLITPTKQSVNADVRGNESRWIGTTEFSPGILYARTQPNVRVDRRAETQVWM